MRTVLPFCAAPLSAWDLGTVLPKTRCILERSPATLDSPSDPCTLYHSSIYRQYTEYSNRSIVDVTIIKTNDRATEGSIFTCYYLQWTRIYIKAKVFRFVPHHICRNLYLFCDQVLKTDLFFPKAYTHLKKVLLDKVKLINIVLKLYRFLNATNINSTPMWSKE